MDEMQGETAVLLAGKQDPFPANRATVAEDRGEGVLVASQPLSRYAPIPEPEPNSLSTTSRPPAGHLQAYYWPTSSQLVSNPEATRDLIWAANPAVAAFYLCLRDKPLKAQCFCK